MSTDKNKTDEIVRHSQKRIIINSWEKPETILVYVRNKKNGMDRYTFVPDTILK